ncbi:MAG: hypothetical protein P8J79_00325 [Halioglobus sp.]|nr:hypothetical protein [Halioglobus sp.]
MNKAIISGILVAIFASQSVFPQVARSERVQFSGGVTEASIDGSLIGYESVNYVVSGEGGQSMTVALDSDNLGAYFNIFEPDKAAGENYAMFIGATEGNQFEGSLPVNGDYTIQVYLIRSATRRGEAANFTLEVKIGNIPDIAQISLLQKEPNK